MFLANAHAVAYGRRHAVISYLFLLGCLFLQEFLTSSFHLPAWTYTQFYITHFFSSICFFLNSMSSSVSTVTFFGAFKGFFLPP